VRVCHRPCTIKEKNPPRKAGTGLFAANIHETLPYLLNQIAVDVPKGLIV
jgi:hypothetical protein